MKKKTKIMIIGSILIVFLITMGMSYAIWQITLQQINENVISTGCFQIEFRDINPINLEKAYPISDEEGASLVPYEFTITNTCNSYASFQINLEILDTTTLENLDYLKVMLENKANILTENEAVTKTLDNAKASYKLESGYLRENQSKTFSLRLWMTEDTPTREDFMNKLFESKVTVIATYKENLDNNIEVSAVSQNESFSGSETFLIHATSESFDLVSMSEDLETWEELETKGKDITVEKTVTKNGSHTFYFQDEAENIQDVTVVATKIDDKKPVANMNVVKENNVIKIDASASRDNETSIAKYYYSKDGTNFEESMENSFQFPLYDYGIAAIMLENYKNQRVYVKVEDEVGNISDVKEYSFIVNELLYDETVDNNLRYVGASPNNYVSFNNELWRIIGVMNNIDDGTGKKETRIKLIRKEAIGGYSWDSSISSVNSGDGINEWSQSDAMKLLNPGYESESVGGSLYWNRGSGTCYNGGNNTTTSCDFSNSGLNETSKTLIGKTLWNIGANGLVASYDSIKTSKFYELERSSNIGKICTSGIYCNDMTSRTTEWTGNIGLMYPSDYGYATSGGTATNRATCLNTVLYSWDSYCKENNWLLYGNYLWTISPAFRSTASLANRVFCMDNEGNLRDVGACGAAIIMPTLYLKSNVKITNGIGSEFSPFELSLN